MAVIVLQGRVGRVDVQVESIAVLARTSGVIVGLAELNGDVVRILAPNADRPCCARVTRAVIVRNTALNSRPISLTQTNAAPRRVA